MLEKHRAHSSLEAEALSGTGRFLLLWLVCVGVFWPAFDNGFISDDFVFLERVDKWLHNPFYLLQIPPENFRSTTYLAILLLKKIAGYQPWAFYLFTMSLHALNAFLLDRLLFQVSGKSSISLLAALLFVAFQNPQEALLWFGGMHELLLGFFALASLLFWAKGRPTLSLIFYCGALFSKESAVVLLGLIPLVEIWQEGRFRIRRAYFYLFIPTLIFVALFAWSFESNSLIDGEFYALGTHALWVWVKSLHRLAFPWLYGFGLAVWLGRQSPPVTLWPGFAWVAMALLPYVFLTYQDHVPSRHEYLASLGVAMLLSILLHGFQRSHIRQGLVAVFLLANAAYILLVKDRQFEERAAPTTQLIEVLERRAPGQIRIVDFPYNPWIAKLTTRLVAGWKPEMIVAGQGQDCPDCVSLRWNRESGSYD